MSYIIYAWMPGTTKFIASRDGKLGFFDSQARTFEPDDNSKLVEAACSKYHYRRIGPYEVGAPEVAGFVDSLKRS